MFKPPSNVGIMICILIRCYIYLIKISIGVWGFFSMFTVRKESQDSFLTRCPWILIVLFNNIFYLLIHQINLLLKMLQSFLLVLNITIKYSFSITCRTCSILILSTIYIKKLKNWLQVGIPEKKFSIILITEYFLLYIKKN